MVEVADYYSFLGLPRTTSLEEMRKQVHKQVMKYLKQANVKGPGSEEAEKRDFWSRAATYFKDEVVRKAYDASLDAWQRSAAAKAARATAQAAAEIFAQNAGAMDLLKQAWRELDRGNLPEALMLLGKALHSDKGNWEIYYALGIANFRWNELEEAMSCLRTAARLNPKAADVYAAMGEVYERQERWKEAFEQYLRASRADPDAVIHLISLGLICVRAGVPDEGLSYLRQAQEREPDHTGLQWVLGIALAESARLGWTYVPDGHPRVPEGWYAMSREEALQAVDKLNEATNLKIQDEDIAKELAALRADVESNVKRQFLGRWFMVGLLAVAGFAQMSSAPGAGIFTLLFAAAYYVVNLAPQYAVNARVLKGESALKRGFFDWYEAQTGWFALVLMAVLFMLLPAFMVYWGIRNWTGPNAPLGSDVGKIKARYTPELPASAESPALPTAQPSLSPSAAAASTADASFDLGSGEPPAPAPARATAPATTPAPARAAEPLPAPAAMPEAAQAVLARMPPIPGAARDALAAGQPVAKQALGAYNAANKMMTWVVGSVVVVVVGLGALFLYKSNNETKLKAELEKQTTQLRAAEQRAQAAEDARRSAESAAARQQQALLAQQQAAAAAATPAPASPVPNGGQLLPPNLNIGDRYTYETIDMMDAKLSNVVSREIVAVGADEVTMKLVNQKSNFERTLVYTRELGLVSSRTRQGDGADYNPPIRYMQFPSRPGDRWTSTSVERNVKTGKTRTHILHAQLEGKETVTVPAGTFEAFKVVIKSQVIDEGKASTGEDTSWYAPQVGRSVKSELRSRDPNGKEGHRVVQLISYSLGR